LAALEPPPTLEPEAAAGVRRAVTDAFIIGFRWVLTLAAALVILGAAMVWLVIENKLHNQSREADRR